MKLKFYIFREISDHDGYCSGGESEYNSEEYERIIHITEQDIHVFKNLTNEEILDLFLGKINLSEKDSYILDTIYSQLDTYECNHHGSGFCTLDEASYNAGLEAHSCRIEIRKVIKSE